MPSADPRRKRLREIRDEEHRHEEALAKLRAERDPIVRELVGEGFTQRPLAKDIGRSRTLIREIAKAAELDE